MRPSDPRPSTALLLLLLLLTLLASVPHSHAKEATHATHRNPFSGSSYRLWKHPRSHKGPQSTEQVIHRSPSVSSESEALDAKGGRFTSDRKSPYVHPGQRGAVR